MRKTASEKSEVVSQSLFAEKLTILEIRDAWSLIQTPDGYSGWVLSDSLVALDSYPASLMVSSSSAHMYGEKDISAGPIQTLPFGVGVMAIDKDDSDWTSVQTPRGEILYMHSGNLSLPHTIKKEELASFSRRFLGLPYTWGGRSSFGYDCSGFVQMLYSRLGVSLPRDSYMQAADPRLQRIEISQLQVGDLIFWGLEESRIRHVGLFLGDGQFIHASAKERMPWLRISSLSDSAWRAKEDSPYPYRTARTPRLQ